MNPLPLIRAAFEALAAYYRAAVIRERRELRRELRTLNHEILDAASAGNAERIALLQNERAEVAADLDALRPATQPDAQAGAHGPRG